MDLASTHSSLCDAKAAPQECTGRDLTLRSIYASSAQRKRFASIVASVGGQPAVSCEQVCCALVRSGTVQYEAAVMR